MSGRRCARISERTGVCPSPRFRIRIGQRLQEWFLTQTARRFRSTVWVADGKSSVEREFEGNTWEGVQVRVIDPLQGNISGKSKSAREQ